MDENTSVIFARTVPNLIGGLICRTVSAVFCPGYWNRPTPSDHTL